MVASVEAALVAPVAGVVIATPAETHYDLVQQALAAGKDVLVEKPLALTYAQGAHLVHLAETYERILMVGHVLEYHPAILPACRPWSSTGSWARCIICIRIASASGRCAGRKTSCGVLPP